MAKVFLRAYNRDIEAMIDRGQLDEAIAHCHHILKIFPKHLETYRLLGKAYLEAKRYGDAVDIFSRVLASVPNDFVSQVGMSIIRDDENKLDDAIWHMERAFETQPSNAAIQSELQRLYGRRDGVQPPRIRMTRGALAHMYVQGELYPQAISEIKSVLKEDPGRSDMQALLARASYKSGAKNDAVDAALALLQRHPYSFDANRVLVEVLSADRNENAQAYRQRVVELDPYAAQVTGSIFLSNEVSDAAVSLERLDWNGQPVGMGDWRDTKAISLESGRSRDEQPDWLKTPSTQSAPPPLSGPTSAFAFDTPSTPAQPADEIPEFLKAAGWGQSTGTFDESTSSSMFADEEPAAAAPALAQGDLPDWIKAMKPAEPEPAAAPANEEEIPDWINNIGKAAIPAAAPTGSDWMNQPGQVDAPQQPVAGSASDEPDWLKGLGESEPSAQPAQDETDWLKGLGSESDFSPQPAQTDTPDWLKNLGDDSSVTPQAAQSDTPDWLKGLGDETEPAAPVAASQSDDDWLKQLGTEASATEPAASSNDFDFLNQLSSEPILQTPESISPPVAGVDELGKSTQEQDDSFAWLENLAAKQGATEGLLTRPEERLEEEPEWVKQAKGSTSELPVSQPPANAQELGRSAQEQDDSFAWLENLAAKQGATEGLLTKPEERLEEEPEWVKQAKSAPVEPSAAQPSAKVEELGKSDQERDDSFAWLENLAAKQGATEGLLTRPEERLEEEPEWVKQAKSAPSEPAVVQPAAKVEELGKSDQERDDSFAWLENLAAKQGATEGLLTKPEERLEEEPEWVKQAKSAPSEPLVAQATASAEELGKSDQERDDSFAWLENLAAKQGATEGLLTKPEERLEAEPEWVRQAKELGTQPPVTPAAEPVFEQPAPVDDTAAWLKQLEEEEKSPEPAAPADTTALWLRNLEQEEAVASTSAELPGSDMPAWMQNIEQDEAPAAEPAVPVMKAAQPVEPVAEAESDIPSWLSDIEKEESTITPSKADDLPAWLRDDTGEVVAEPIKIEPTRPTDWRPVEAKQPEPQPVPQEPEQPKIIYSPPLEETQAPPLAQPEPAFEAPRETPAAPPPPVEKPAPARKTPSRPARVSPPPAPPEPYKEPVTMHRGTGMLMMPGIDPMLGTARAELSRSNIPGALESYGRLIKKGRFLDEVIYDLREALYRYPVEVSIWQALGDAYMRANRLQDALDAYTKAEELLR